MANTVTTVTNLDIQLLDESRAGTTTIKLDNPKANVTREQVSAAMQPAFTNGWFLTSKGTTAMYLGDVTINQSIKTKLAGEDFYVTPASLTFTAADAEDGLAIQVSGATIQGYNLLFDPQTQPVLTATISDNGLTITVKIDDYISGQTMAIELVIQGSVVNIPITTT